MSPEIIGRVKPHRAQKGKKHGHCFNLLHFQERTDHICLTFDLKPFCLLRFDLSGKTIRNPRFSQAGWFSSFPLHFPPWCINMFQKFWRSVTYTRSSVLYQISLGFHLGWVTWSWIRRERAGVERHLGSVPALSPVVGVKLNTLGFGTLLSSLLKWRNWYKFVIFSLCFLESQDFSEMSQGSLWGLPTKKVGSFPSPIM